MPGRPQGAILQESAQILDIIAACSRGVGRADIAIAYARHYGSISHRTLQRRLGEMVREGQLVAEGKGPARLYRASRIVQAPAPPGGGPEADGRAETAAGQISVSAEGAEIREVVRGPIIARAPVGYDRKFLETYVPGKTWYLSPALRQHLHEVGRTAEPGRPAGTFARDIFGRLLIDLAWASSRLEGNTYSRLDTQNLLEFGQRAEGKDAAETQMILNHKNAIELLVEDVEQLRFARRTILTLHAALSENLLASPADEGRLRTRMVNITGTTFTPVAIPQVIEECFDLLLQKVTAIGDPFEQSFFVMVQLPYLQPFVDVNKRTSRLAANIPMIRENLCPLSFVDVPERDYVDGTVGIYELRRIELLRDVFAWAYERSCAQYKVVREALGQPDPVRLRYRNQLEEVVRETVLGGNPPRRASLESWADVNGIAPQDRAAFAERALDILLNLREGTAGRYRIRASELRAWESAHRTGGQ